MGKRHGWFESLCIIAMCFTEVSGSVNILCLNLFVDHISISLLSQGSVSTILVDHSLDNSTDVQLFKITNDLIDLKVF